MDDKTQLSPPPIQEPFLDGQGRMSPRWQSWLNGLFVRVGGKLAPSNLQIEETIDEHETRIADLE